MSLRKILFWIHLATGCLAGVVVLIMSVTGILLAYQRQIINWADRDYRSEPPVSSAGRLPIEAILATAAAQNEAASSAITLRSDPRAPAEVSFGREKLVLVDVYSGKVLGEGSQRTRALFQQVENWHRWLGAMNENRTIGRGITGACNFGFLFLVLSGPFLWIPRKWSWKKIKPIAFFRGGLSGRARDFNWHNVIGIWCAMPLFLIVLSGVIMSYPWANNLLYRITGNEPPVQAGERARGESHAKSNLAGLNLLWTRAEQQVPGWRSLTLRMPPSGHGPLTFTIDTGSGGRPDQRSQLTLDRRTADVVRWEPFSSYNAGRRLRSWFRFLHTGEAGGMAGQSIAGIASAGAVMLVWTGLWLACRRLVRWGSRTADRDREMIESR